MESTTNYINTASSRKTTLGSLIADARKADISDDGVFHEVLRACQRILELTDQQIADALHVSRPTVNRWINGKNLPQALMRKPIFNWIASQAARKLKIHQELEEQQSFGSPTESYAIAARG
jgi:transcriptional regulator with XRE-family HTH domain